jgi:hypothetical protein
MGFVTVLSKDRSAMAILIESAVETICGCLDMRFERIGA